MNIATSLLSESSNLLFTDKAIDKIIDRQRGTILVIKHDKGYHVIGGILHYRVMKNQPTLDCTVMTPTIVNGTITDLH